MLNPRQQVEETLMYLSSCSENEGVVYTDVDDKMVTLFRLVIEAAV